MSYRPFRCCVVLSHSYNLNDIFVILNFTVSCYLAFLL